MRVKFVCSPVPPVKVGEMVFEVTIREVDDLFFLVAQESSPYCELHRLSASFVTRVAAQSAWFNGFSILSGGKDLIVTLLIETLLRERLAVRIS